VEENELLEIAAGKQRLVDFLTPFFGRTDLEVSREIDIKGGSQRRTYGTTFATLQAALCPR
jgi:hypothetical protein